MPEHTHRHGESGSEREVTFHDAQGNPKQVTLHETHDHENVGAHRHPGEVYGVAAVTKLLHGLDFPASKRDVLQHVKGHEEVHWSKDQTVNLRVIFDRLPDTEFASPVEVVEDISNEVRSGK